MTEPLETKCVGKLLNIAWVIQQLTPGLIVRVANARAVRRQNSETVPHRLIMKKMALQPAARHTMAKNQWVAVWIANIGIGQSAAIAKN